MGGFLKFLVGAACLVVIAAGAWLAWSEWQKSSVISSAKRDVDTAWAAIYKAAGAETGDVATARVWCESVHRLVRRDMKANPMALTRAEQCRLVGL